MSKNKPIVKRRFKKGKFFDELQIDKNELILKGKKFTTKLPTKIRSFKRENGLTRED